MDGDPAQRDLVGRDSALPTCFGNKSVLDGNNVRCVLCQCKADCAIKVDGPPVLCCKECYYVMDHVEPEKWPDVCPKCGKILRQQVVVKPIKKGGPEGPHPHKKGGPDS